jgi:hypothetical protein
MLRPKLGSLLTETIRLYTVSGINLAKVAVDTGLPYWWLRKVTKGEILDPSVNRVQMFYEYIAKKPLLPVEPSVHELEQSATGT